MGNMTLLCRNATTFKKNGEIDEPAFREFLQRFSENKLGVYLGSSGSGEGASLTMDDLKKIYTIGVEELKGKVQVNSNQPEQGTARDSLAHAKLAASCGIETLNIYGPNGSHGYKCTDEEYIAYFDHILSQLNHQVALCPNQVIGYSPKPATLCAIVKKYPQVTSINLSGIVGDSYFIHLMDQLPRKVEIYVAYPGSRNTLAMGATGLLGAEANIIPKTFRRYIDAYEGNDQAELNRSYSELRLFTTYVAQFQSSTPRWIKMALKGFKMPGGEGGPREPYKLPPDSEISKFMDGLLKLGIREIEDHAKKAGLSVPAKNKAA